MSRVYDQREDLHAARKREERSLPHHPQEGRDRRITEQSKAKKEDRVLSVLKQIENLKYADFYRVAHTLDMGTDDLHRSVTDAIAEIEGEKP